ncbi:MAG: hypothetical protein E2P02_08400 [Acidobacteria bacterium]|nr:MAG: hypothetical protein E2P02_08400 [Acidobacteriota bacterium]
MRMTHRLSCLTFALLGVAPLVAAQNSPIDYERARLERRLNATRAEGPIVIDGVLDEEAWKSAPIATNFIQSEPEEGAPAMFDTEVRVLYDENNLYFGVLAHDDDPDSLIIKDLTRDFATFAVDGFSVILDTFHDRRNSYIFSTNPMGAKSDAQSLSEGQEFNEDWNGVWHVAGQIEDRGWTAEFAIPFKTLKFKNVDSQNWGINFLRRNRRFNEESYWSPIPRIYDASRVSLAGTLEELRDLRPGTRFKLTPFATANVSESSDSDTDGSFEGGLDAKVSVSTGLTLDLTLNTDFSQAEADLQQVNLSRFSLFFPEKRDFFLENAGIFRFGPPEDPRFRRFRRQAGLSAGSGFPAGQTRGNDLLLFFSRRIGLSEGRPIPVQGGGRLTGRYGAYQIGLLSIQTGEEEGLSTGDNFSVVRVKRDILANSDIGVMFINRESMNSSHFNRSIGVDANFRVTRRKWTSTLIGPRRRRPVFLEMTGPGGSAGPTATEA